MFVRVLRSFSCGSTFINPVSSFTLFYCLTFFFFRLLTLEFGWFWVCVCECDWLSVCVSVCELQILPHCYNQSCSSLEDDNGGDEEWSGDKLHGIHDAVRRDVSSFQWGKISHAGDKGADSLPGHPLIRRCAGELSASACLYEKPETQ